MPTAFHKVNRDPKPPRDCDAVPEHMCLNCGVTSAAGKHQTLEQCVNALRDELATLQLGRPRHKREA
jgi:hypothetical protein